MKDYLLFILILKDNQCKVFMGSDRDTFIMDTRCKHFLNCHDKCKKLCSVDVDVDV